MSNAAINWAKRQTVGNASGKLILLMLADAHGYRNLSLPELAVLTELSERMVRYHLRALEKAGLIATTITPGVRSAYRLVGLDPGNPLPGSERGDPGNPLPHHPGNLQQIAPGNNCTPLSKRTQEQERTKKGTGKRGAKRAPDHGTRLPPDFQPDLRVALAEGFAQQRAERMAANFIDYWKSAAGAKGRKADWPATWRVWCRNENQKRGTGPPRRQAARDDWDDLLNSEREQRHGQQGQQSDLDLGSDEFSRAKRN